MSKVTRSTPLYQIGIPHAVIQGELKLFPGLKSTGEPPTIDHLARTNVVELMAMPFVGWTKVQQCRKILNDYGYTLQYDPPLPEENPASPPPLTSDQARLIRRKARHLRRTANELLAELSTVDDADDSPKGLAR